MQTDLSLREMQKEWHGTFKAYAIGFILSLILTSISFYLVLTKTLDGPPLIYTLVGLALLQAIFQLLFFLHVGQEPKPRWETVVFFFMLLILLITATGSMWVMHDLNERVMGDMMKDMPHG